jgi:hypothetical protein
MKNMWANFQRTIELLPQKLSLRSQNYVFRIRDPRSGKKYSGSQIPDPGVKIAPDPRFRIRIPQYWILYLCEVLYLCLKYANNILYVFMHAYAHLCLCSRLIMLFNI